MAGSLTALSAHRFNRSKEDAADVFEQASRFLSVVETYLQEKSIL